MAGSCGGRLTELPLFDAIQSQPTQAEPPLARARRERDEALKRIADHGKREWRKAAEDVALRLAEEKASFTSDDVMEALGTMHLPDQDPRLLGAVLRGLAVDGKIKKLGYEPSRRRHCAPVVTWAKGS